MEGARYVIGWSMPVKSAMKLWSPRSDTNASVRPSGDQTGEPLVPRAKSDSAGFDPSIGAIQIRLSRTYAMRPVFGAIAGSSPSPSNMGEPPADGTVQTCIFAWMGLAAGSGSRLPSAGQLDP